MAKVIQDLPAPLRVSFGASGGHERMLWTRLVMAGTDAMHLSPAQIKAFALSKGKRAKADQIDAELIAGS